MKRIGFTLLALILAFSLIGQAEALPRTIERIVPLEGIDEARTYSLAPDAQGRFSIYIDEGFYEAVQTDEGMTIQQKGGGAQMVLTVLEGRPEALREAFITPEMTNDESLWAEEFETPIPGCGVVFSEGEKTRSVYWFDAGDGRALAADFTLSPEEQEGHGVRMWDMLETLVF